MESVIGAVYISDDFSAVGAEQFFNNVLRPFYDRHISLKTLSHHPTKVLFELLQAQGCQQFQIVKDQTKNMIEQYTQCDGMDLLHHETSYLRAFAVIVHDVILASAFDTTSALAAKRASFSALDALEGDPDFMARTCDCRSTTQAKKGQKKAIEQALAGFSDDEDLMAVESILAERDGMDSDDEAD